MKGCVQVSSLFLTFTESGYFPGTQPCPGVSGLRTTRAHSPSWWQITDVSTWLLLRTPQTSLP